MSLWTLVMSVLALLIPIGVILLKIRWRREDRKDAFSERADQAKKDRQEKFDAKVQRFLDCMAEHDGRSGLGESIRCGLTGFESDEEIRQVNEKYRKRHVRTPSVFGGLERDFEGKNAKKLLDAWQAKSPEEQQQAGGLTVFVQNWPRDA